MRNVNGVLFLDKSTGVSSASLLRRVKMIFRAKKAGHTGTLDRLATGMLPICFGEATKFSRYLLEADKSYRVIAKLGERTDTFDSLGQIVCIRPVKFSITNLNCIINSFIGMSYQVPPMFSAIKYCGYPLYYYARQGIDVLRNFRLINIYKINLIRWDDKYIELDVFCSKGTYVRSFIDDLGESLGCGAHVVALRRFSIAHFTSALMINIEELQNFFKGNWNYLECFKKIDKLLYPIDILVSHFPEINVSREVYYLLKFGQQVKIDTFINSYFKVLVSNNIKNNDILVRMTVGCEKIFFGVGSIIDSKYLSARRLVCI